MARFAFLRIIVSLLLLPALSDAQIKTININGAEVRYDDTHKHFVISGVAAGSTRGIQNMPDPFLIVFIQTGDGHYIQHNFPYSSISSGISSPDLHMPYEYKTSGGYIGSTTLVKTYDKGGPRTRKLEMNDIRATGNAAVVNNYDYTDAALVVSLFPRDVVAGDAMSGVATIHNTSTIPKAAVLSFTMDRLLTAKMSLPPGVTQERWESGNNKYVRVTMPSVPERSVLNVFFEVVPEQAENLGDEEELLFVVYGAGALPFTSPPDSTLEVLSAHDPNSLTLPLNCPYFTANQAFLYELDIENTGFADETDISVGLRYDKTKFEAGSLNIVSAEFQGQGTTVPEPIYNSLLNPRLFSLLNSTCLLQFTQSTQTLQGVNQCLQAT
ncbi:MAG TPA: hypothetical protein VD993_17340 [Chitinophagaceae bacterium]|nr:hypothetical protein [Chitinophagaceae bacterium]